MTGSLHVTGALLDGSHPLSSLTVLGSLFASNAVTRGELVIGGDVRITNLWYLNSGNDYTVHIAGDVHAAVFYEDGMRTTIGGTLTGAAVSLHNEVTTRVGKLARGTVDPQCFAEDVLDEDAPAVEKLVEAARLERALLRR
ncbi:MAG: hypothetical protein HOV81_16285 [Kofleriaceae bacterium]|nr:hypothetical protein [Kofleriaceae bacterium]